MTDRKQKLLEAMAVVGLGTHPQSLINGELVDGTGSEVQLVDPFTEEVLFTYADAGNALAANACDAARQAQTAWAKGISAAARGQVMQDIGRAVLEKVEPLATIEAIIAGKPIRDCRIEVTKVAEMFAYYAGWADKLHGEVIPVPSGHLNYTLREPLGVVFQITPWNAPIFTAGWQIAPAIATGNGVVIKPSELTPLTTVALVKIAESVGLPVGLVNVLCGLGPTSGQAAIAHSAVRKVVFVGSPETGKRVAVAAAEALKPVVLELGGKSANIVFEDANLEHACLGAQAAIFSGAGQSCVAGSRLLVHKSVHAELVGMLSKGMNNIKLGDPLDDATEVGPISNARQFAHVRDMVMNAKNAGASVLTRSDTKPQGYFVPPTILDGLSNTATAAQTEIFGPVVTAIPFEDEADAIALANATNFGLAGAVWTADVGRAHRMADAVRAGTFWINSYKAIHVSSPFGGSLNSGFGRSSGTDALMEYTSAKSVWLDSAPTPRIAFGYVS
ncbi:aldehyde dehydrogenase family protein [Pacificibacter marinus]|uniref:Putative aldehyde dehydrogenase AldA n=1 Tax=Pacificibacter marinus TaxID=658057 RepID=A0A1Y5RU05_9RHOB|nr:aldehyde dehydrogenase family protein [Pacificibacter marinus]SEK39610.1 Aldehyde dehydrogenase family protein [Pacificibacter marinus]SLN25422.1 Putative aldehyde dehydrogenase AldA [Pacificibacter marinus]